MTNRIRLFKVLAVLFSCALLSTVLAQCASVRLRAQREEACRYAVREASAAFGVPAPLVYAVIRTESDFRPDAVSAAGAQGLMQLMPDTFRFLREEKFGEALADEAVFDPDTNIRYGTCYLAYLYDRFGDWRTALAAYNAGEGRVEEWLSDPELAQDGRLTRIPFPETVAYVEKTWKSYASYCEKLRETPMEKE